MEGFLIRRWDLIVPGRGATSPSPRRAVIAARWPHKAQPTVNQPAGSGFHILRGGIDPGELRVRRGGKIVDVWKGL